MMMMMMTNDHHHSLHMRPAARRTPHSDSCSDSGRSCAPPTRTFAQFTIIIISHRTTEAHRSRSVQDCSMRATAANGSDASVPRASRLSASEELCPNGIRCKRGAAASEGGGTRLCVPHDNRKARCDITCAIRGAHRRRPCDLVCVGAQDGVFLLRL